jgi:hypothetical protein
MVCIQKCHILGPFHSLGNHPQAYLLGGCLASITLSGGPILLICRPSLPLAFLVKNRSCDSRAQSWEASPLGWKRKYFKRRLLNRTRWMDGWWSIFLTEAGGEIVTVIVMELCWMYGRSANLGTLGIVAKVRG